MRREYTSFLTRALKKNKDCHSERSEEPISSALSILEILRYRSEWRERGVFQNPSNNNLAKKGDNL